MNILICSDVFPSLSGIAQCVNQITEILKKEHKVEILCLRKENQKKYEKINEIKVHRVKISEIDDFMKKNEKNFDLIISSAFNYLLSATKYFNNVIYDLPSLRSTTFRFLPQYKKERVAEIIKQEKKGMEKCKLVYPSKCVKEQAEKEYGIKSGKIIPHGVDLKKFIPCDEEKKYDVITVANLNDLRKGVDKLISCARFSKANFIVLGDGVLREDYEKLISKFNLKNIKLLGQKKSSEYYDKAKIYVLPSVYEAFGLVLLEAMASGLPCIAFKPDGENIITASDEIIKDGVTGFLVKNEKEMAEKIELLLSDEELGKKMGKAGRKEAEKYSWEKAAKEILDLAGG